MKAGRVPNSRPMEDCSSDESLFENNLSSRKRSAVEECAVPSKRTKTGSVPNVELDDSETQEEIHVRTSPVRHRRHGRSERPKKTIAFPEDICSFACTQCRIVFPQSNLQNHQQFGHNFWDLRHPNAKPAETDRLNERKRSFPEQGYGLSTERARDLSLDEALTMLHVREQVSETTLVVNVEHSQGPPSRVKLQHCNNFQQLAFRVAHSSGIERNMIEQLLLMPALEFDEKSEPGVYHVIFAEDEDSFNAFISMIAKARRERNGEPRKLLFLCKVFLRQES